jgi:membrane protein
MGMSAEVAYNLLFALFPTLIFIAALAGFVGTAVGVDDLFDQILAALNQVLPAEAVAMIAGPILAVLSTRSTELLSISAALALWAASNATAVMMKGFNRAYNVKETRPFWLYRLVIAIGLTLLMVALVLVAFLALSLGDEWAAALVQLLGLHLSIATIWQYVRLPLAALAILVALAFLYWLGPNIPMRFRLFSPGALASTLLWIAFTFLFQIYVVLFPTFSLTYGTIAGIIILMLWLQYSGLVFILGAELNHVLDQRRAARAALAAESAAADSAPAERTAPAALAGPPTPGGERRRGGGSPGWLGPATLAAWTLVVLIRALRRGGRPHYDP